MIRDLLKKELVMTNIAVPANTKEDAIAIMSEKCAAFSGLSASELCEGFLEREALDSTGFGNNVAIPHAKLECVKEPLIAIFKFENGIEWDALDGEPVQIAIALIMPKTGDTHLQVISKFSRKLMNDDFISGLMGANDATDLYNFVITELEG